MKYTFENKFLFNSIPKNVELIVYLTIGFIVPLSIGHPQYLVGVIVNTILATSAFRNVNSTKRMALAITPSIGALMHGILFGNLTNFLIYFLPIIWISNIIYMNIIKANNENRSEENKQFFTTFIKKTITKNKLSTVIIASIAKSAIIFITSLILVTTNIVPKSFLITMGAVQIITALAGGGVGIGINYLLNKSKIRN